jgi:hypothetical protein
MTASASYTNSVGYAKSILTCNSSQFMSMEQNIPNHRKLVAVVIVSLLSFPPNRINSEGGEL